MAETRGVAFEVTSPGPPNVLSGIDGFKAAVDMLTTLKSMGIQAGPSQGMHVHVNVRGNAPGSRLSRRQIAYVWIAYARWQHAINEMLSPSRVPSKYADGLFLGRCSAITFGDFTKDQCGRTRRIFEHLHTWLERGSAWDHRDDGEFCNYILGMPGDHRPCDKRFPKVRYQQINLVPIKKFGTIEFRGHSATYDAERVMRWVQFVVAFVERFGKAGGATTGMKGFFDSTASADYNKLQTAQQQSTSKSLLLQLKSGCLAQARKWRSPDFLSYYGDRRWETRDRQCSPSTPASKVSQTCNSYPTYK